MYHRIKNLLCLLCENDCIHEDPQDIITESSEYDETKYILKCLQCGGKSGTLLEISHYYNCKYKMKIDVSTPIVEGSLLPASVPFDQSSCLFVGQREYAVVCKNHAKPIIGSLWASSCIILCMRNRETTETILTHIDGLSLNPITKFLSFPPDLCDVFLIGGNCISKNDVKQLIQTLEDYKYIIKYCCIINETLKSFAVNSIDGTTYCDEDFDNLDINALGDITKSVTFTMTPLKKIMN